MNLDQATIKREGIWFQLWQSGRFNVSTPCWTANTGSYVGNGAPYYCNGWDNDEIPMGFVSSGVYDSATMRNPETWVVGSNDITSWPSGTTAYGIYYSSGTTIAPVAVMADSYHVQALRFYDNALYFLGPTPISGSLVSAFYRYTGNPRVTFTRPAPLYVASDGSLLDFDMQDATTAWASSTGALLKLTPDPASTSGAWMMTSYVSNGISFLQVRRDATHWLQRSKPIEICLCTTYVIFRFFTKCSIPLILQSVAVSQDKTTVYVTTAMPIYPYTSGVYSFNIAASAYNNNGQPLLLAPANYAYR